MRSAEIPRFKNCLACDISSGCRTLRGGHNESPKRAFSRGVWGHAPPTI